MALQCVKFVFVAHPSNKNVLTIYVSDIVKPTNDVLVHCHSDPDVRDPGVDRRARLPRRRREPHKTEGLLASDWLTTAGHGLRESTQSERGIKKIFVLPKIVSFVFMTYRT